MNFISNAGFTPILNKLKDYMGHDENIVESKISAELILIEMGKKHTSTGSMQLWTSFYLITTSKNYSRTISTPHHGIQCWRVSRESATRAIRTESYQCGIKLLPEPWILKLFFCLSYQIWRAGVSSQSCALVGHRRSQEIFYQISISRTDVSSQSCTLVGHRRSGEGIETHYLLSEWRHCR